MASWRIFCETPDGTPMVSSAMSRERAISRALDLKRRGDRIIKIESNDGEVVDQAEFEANLQSKALQKRN